MLAIDGAVDPLGGNLVTEREKVMRTASALSIDKKTLDVVATLMIVLVSGNPVVQHLFGKAVILLGVPVVLVCYGLLRGLRVTRTDLLAVSLFCLISAVHFATFGYGALPATLGFLLKLVAAMLVARTVKDFSGVYVRLMCALAMLSFAFYVPQILTGGLLREWASSLSVPYVPGVVHVGLHNFSFKIHEFRNSGFFWEPGAFAGYLLLALVLHFSQKLGRGDSLKVDRTALVLLGALLTTQSTAGYAALLVLVFALVYLRFGVRYVLRLAGVCVALGTVAFVAYLQLPFLSEKISGQFESAQVGAERSEINRFGNIAYDAESIQRRPLLGWSPSIETRSVVDYAVSDVVAGQGNGLTGLIVRFGFVGFVIYAVFVYRSFFMQSRSRFFAVAALVVVLLLLMGEQYLNYPLFLILMFGSRVAIAKSTTAFNHQVSASAVR